MNRCCYSLDGKCSGNIKYGTYCYKHRSNYLLENNRINETKFTGLSKDYLKKDLESYHQVIMRQRPSNQKKGILFSEVNKFITRFNESC